MIAQNIQKILEGKKGDTSLDTTKLKMEEKWKTAPDIIHEYFMIKSVNGSVIYF